MNMRSNGLINRQVDRLLPPLVFYPPGLCLPYDPTYSKPRKVITVAKSCRDPQRSALSFSSPTWSLDHPGAIVRLCRYKESRNSNQIRTFLGEYCVSANFEEFHDHYWAYGLILSAWNMIISGTSSHSGKFQYTLKNNQKSFYFCTQLLKKRIVNF